MILRMSQETPHFKIRLPLELKARLESSAKEQGRSLTADIVWRLEKSFETNLTYQLLDRRFDEAEALSDQLLAGEKELAVLRKQLEAASKLKDGGRDGRIAEIAARTKRTGADMQIAARQAKRIQAEIQSLIADLNERAYSALPPLAE